MKLPYHFVTIIDANNMISHSCPLQIIAPINPRRSIGCYLLFVIRLLLIIILISLPEIRYHLGYLVF